MWTSKFAWFDRHFQGFSWKYFFGHENTLGIIFFWVKIDSQNVQESFAFLQKDFTHLQYHTLYHTMRNSNCHSMEAIIIIECIVQDRKWKSNKVPILIFSTLNSFWVNKWHMNGEIPLITSIKPLPTTILYTLRTMQ